MIQGVASGASTAQVAIEAALKAHAAASKRIETELANAGAQPAASKSVESDFVKTLGEGLRGANAEVAKVESLPAEMLAGKVSDFHEIAARIKQSELTFKFALEVRNKLIDAYRETMRMSV